MSVVIQIEFEKSFRFILSLYVLRVDGRHLNYRIRNNALERDRHNPLCLRLCQNSFRQRMIFNFFSTVLCFLYFFKFHIWMCSVWKMIVLLWREMDWLGATWVGERRMYDVPKKRILCGIFRCGWFFLLFFSLNVFVWSSDQSLKMH